MSKNKVKKTVSLNCTNPDDLKIIDKINKEGFIFNAYVRKLILEDIRKEEIKSKMQRNEKGGIIYKP